MFGIKQFSLVLLLGLIAGIKSSPDLCTGKCLEEDSGIKDLFLLKDLVSRLPSFRRSQRLEVFLTSEDVTGCKGTCPIMQDDKIVHLAHKNCTKFCKCDHGMPYVFQCPAGLHFNAKLEVCDHPSHAGCVPEKPILTVPQSSYPKISLPKKQYKLGGKPDDTSGCKGQCPIWEGDTVVHLAHKDCTKFCKCDFGMPYVFECPHGLHFNPKLEVCDRPSHAGCVTKP